MEGAPGVLEVLVRWGVGFDELMCVWLCLSGCFTFSVVTWSYLECLQ